MDQLENKMEEFLLKGHETLEVINKTMKLYKWLFGGTLLFVLGIVLDTRVEVVKKADANEIQMNYVTKIDALNVHKLEQAYTNKLISSTILGEKVDTTNYEWLISSICDINHRGE